VWLAVEAAKQLESQGVGARVVSAFAPQLLEREPELRERLLGPVKRRVSLEAGATDYWYRFIGLEGLAIGVDRFGASAPYPALQEFFGLTPDGVANRVKEWAARS